MADTLKTYFQEIHYSRKKPNLFLTFFLSIAEFFYKSAINIKNTLYKIGILKEKKTNTFVVCVGNLTTGGVGKTPIVIDLANKLSKEKKVAIISRGYGAKLSNKEPNVIKDYGGLKFENGLLCGDEPFQIAKKVNNNVVVITCQNRKKAIDFALIKYGIDIAILDDGFSNRKVKKDKTILVIDSKMRFGNGHLLPFGPLREPISELKRADELILVNKGDENLDEAIVWTKNFNKPAKLCQMKPGRIYNSQTGADVKINEKHAIAFCAIGQPKQFFDFAKEYYEIYPIIFEDHHKYTKSDINKLIKIAQEKDCTTFITTQKDETKLSELIKNLNGYSFNVLELEVSIEDI